MIFATTDSMRCFERRDLRHKRLTWPHKKQMENEMNNRNNEEHIDRTENTEISDKEKRPVIASKKQK